MLDAILELEQSQLAVMAAIIELEISEANAAAWAPPDTALIYAHNVFGVDRGAALDALPTLLDDNLIETVQSGPRQNADPNVPVTLRNDPDDECRIVLYGRIQEALGKTVVPQITGRVVREQYEKLRLESTIVITEPGAPISSDSSRWQISSPTTGSIFGLGRCVRCWGCELTTAVTPSACRPSSTVQLIESLPKTKRLRSIHTPTGGA
ncbi:hypothetical protein [Williamsia deligens]|uniref:DUF222 domain-containing protein n=1 Tax=Williamsia deligens TaxID=321325 RepID=A0ABW3GEX5_9NOCA|nr:hypothetical protein [Williamsia deligens]